ncbi:hypothetical protein DSO57_1039758 [Entomophthora muscae]|uniref:Uncharacterized protein n=2 Tax=Entomophthora muscae TaxID=34485 RepID=A0ACC2SC27_9FUNG|nr:hypothetical protein DSO57_1039758 [Entomophthora muscae]
MDPLPLPTVPQVKRSSSDVESPREGSQQSGDDDRTSWVYKRGYARKEPVEGGFRIHCLRDNCNKSFRTKDGSTSNIRRHLNKKHGKYELPKNNASTTSKSASRVSPKPVKTETNTGSGNSQNKLLELCLLSHIPFKAVDHPSFRSFLVKGSSNKKSEAKANRVSELILESIPDVFKKKIQEVKFLLQQQPHISITCNIWHSPYSDDFLSITSHFVDSNWRQREIMIGFENLNPSYTGFNLAHRVMQTLENFNITSKLFTITTDNSILMNDMIATIEEVSARQTGFTFSKSRQHILCLGQVIDSSAQAAISCSLGFASAEDPLLASQPISGSFPPGIYSPLAKICTAICVSKNVNENGNYIFELWQSFYQKRPILVADVIRRWSATYSMIGKVIDTYEEYNASCLLLELSDLQLTPADLIFLKDLHFFLKHFFVLTVFLSSSKFPTLNRTFRVYELLLKHLVENSSPGKPAHIVQAACQAHARLDKHFKNLHDKSSYSVALAMDPRLKYSFWRDTLEDATKAYMSIADVEMIWNTHIKVSSKDAPEAGQPDLFESFFAYNRKRTQDDLERYVTEELADNDLQSPSPELDYWRTSHEKFPALSIMAKKYLAIPAVSSPCEKVFSNAQLIIPDYLNRLRPTVIRECMLLESWLGQSYI